MFSPYHFCLINLSCGKSELLPVDYINWSDDPQNNLVKKYSQNGISLTCQYTTAEYMALKQNGSKSIIEKDVLELVDELRNFLQFKFRFTREGETNFLKNNYTSAEVFDLESSYLSFGIGHDLKLVCGEDTVNCIINHHERTYGNTSYETVLLSFPNNYKDAEGIELILDDRVFGLGRVKFFLKKSELDKIPELIFL